MGCVCIYNNTRVTEHTAASMRERGSESESERQIARVKEEETHRGTTFFL